MPFTPRQIARGFDKASRMISGGQLLSGKAGSGSSRNYYAPPPITAADLAKDLKMNPDIVAQANYSPAELRQLSDRYAYFWLAKMFVTPAVGLVSLFTSAVAGHSATLAVVTTGALMASTFLGLGLFADRVRHNVATRAAEKAISELKTREPSPS